MSVLILIIACDNIYTMAKVLKFNPCILEMVLKVQNLTDCVQFYTKCFGMSVRSTETANSEVRTLRFEKKEQPGHVIGSLQLVSPKTPPSSFKKVRLCKRVKIEILILFADRVCMYPS